MSESPESTPSGAEKRRSTRVLHAASITVKGTDALGRAFRESTKTVMVNCFGCLYQGARYPAPSSAIMLEIRNGNPRRPPRVVPGRVIWVQRPQHYRPHYHVGIEFEVPGNVWDIALPPEDWFPCPEDEDLVIPASSEEILANPNQFVLRASVADVESSDVAAQTQMNGQISTGRITETLPLPEETQPFARADSSGVAERRPAAVVDMVRMLTAEAVAEELVRIREFIDSELRNAVDRAVERLIDGMTTPIDTQQVTATPPMPVAEAIQECEPATESEEPAVPAIPPGGNGTANLTARQRRAMKRAQKMQKAKPEG